MIIKLKEQTDKLNVNAYFLPFFDKVVFTNGFLFFRYFPVNADDRRNKIFKAQKSSPLTNFSAQACYGTSEIFMNPQRSLVNLKTLFEPNLSVMNFALLKNENPVYNSMVFANHLNQRDQKKFRRK